MRTTNERRVNDPAAAGAEGRLERQLHRRAKELGFEVVKAADPPGGGEPGVSSA
jgi:hypothetical protein